MTTLVEVNDAWNDLRNAAQGRGVVPVVPAGLNARVQASYADWRAYYEAIGPLSEPLVPSVELAREISAYRALAKEVKAAGAVLAAELPATPLEQVARAASNTFGMFETLAMVAALGFGAALLVALKGRRS